LGVCQINPRPKSNNSGGWYYRLDDLIKATEIVNTLTV
jgi:(2Fe-2S) ferredoxin